MLNLNKAEKQKCNCAKEITSDGSLHLVVKIGRGTELVYMPQRTTGLEIVLFTIPVKAR